MRATAYIYIPLVDSRRRSLLRAYTLWSEHLLSLRAAGLTASAARLHKAAHTLYCRHTRSSPIDDDMNALPSEEAATHKQALLDFLSTEPEQPYRPATESDLVREYLHVAIARLAKLEDKQKEPHARCAVPKIIF